MKHRPLSKIDFYKADHASQQPPGTVKIYGNGTFRKSRIAGINHIVWFGLQYVIKELYLNIWQKEFFEKPLAPILEHYQRRMDNSLGKGFISMENITKLHKLGYMPLKIKSLPEGTLVPIKVPPMTITNTHDDFAWLALHQETVISNMLWRGPTSATIAFQYRKTFEHYHRLTVGRAEENGFIMWQGHDFSYRGMGGNDDAMLSGAAHLLSFFGTDTVPAIDFLEDYYGADSDNEIIGGSIPATEHSVMCMGIGVEGEYETIKRLITQVYPHGPVGIVSDTNDYWNTLLKIISDLKSDIMARAGHPLGLDKVVVRPDSGDPYRIIVGYFPEEYGEVDGKMFARNSDGSLNLDKEIQNHEIDGSIQVLWNVFGGYETPLGYKQLCPKIGLIYGDSITMDLQVRVLEGLMRKGFASTNVVLGIGSFTYVYTTRDTFGFAMKATYGEVRETSFKSSGGSISQVVSYNISKNPKTDSGIKKSAKGLLMVQTNERSGQLEVIEECTQEQERQGLLEEVFVDGKLLRETTLSEIRERINSNF